LSDHAAQNLRTTSIGLSIWLLLRSIWSAFRRAPINASPTADTIPTPPVAAAASMNVRRETWGAKSFFMSVALAESLDAQSGRIDGKQPA